MKHYDDKSEFDETFKRYESIDFPDKNKVYGKMMRTLEGEEKTQKFFQFVKPAISTVIAAVIFLFGGYYLFTNFILEENTSEEFRNGEGQGQGSSNPYYQELEQEIYDVFGKAVHVPVHESLQLGTAWIPHNQTIVGDVTSREPSGVILAYGLEEHLESNTDEFHLLFGEPQKLLTSTYLKDEHSIVVVSVLERMGAYAKEMEIADHTVSYHYDQRVPTMIDVMLLHVRLDDLVYLFDYSLVDGHTEEDAIAFVESFIKQVEGRK
ncbi:MAG: hypothetical protein LRY73_14150 [Bacillus sp. (in: Bacteria)]|nr:hypothetical protein [Bacillus sp. (in: firmicutes)]